MLCPSIWNILSLTPTTPSKCNLRLLNSVPIILKLCQHNWSKPISYIVLFIMFIKSQLSNLVFNDYTRATTCTLIDIITLIVCLLQASTCIKAHDIVYSQLWYLCGICLSIDPIYIHVHPGHAHGACHTSQHYLIYDYNNESRYPPDYLENHAFLTYNNCHSACWCFYMCTFAYNLSNYLHAQS